MDLVTKSVLEHGIENTVNLIDRGFADYFVKRNFDLVTVMDRVHYDGVDLAKSRVVLLDGEPVGVALIAQRGWSRRLAAMAIIPQVRSRGIGKWLMANLIGEAKSKNDRRMVLEVIEMNQPAVNLYRSSGFHIIRRLVSYASPSIDLGANYEEFEEVDIRDVAGMVIAHAIPDLPWQLSGESLVQLSPPYQAFRLDQAFIVLSDLSKQQVAIRAMLVTPESRGQGQARNILSTLMKLHPDKEWQVPPICPEEIGYFFEKVGFEKQPLSQLQMALAL